MFVGLGNSEKMFMINSKTMFIVLKTFKVCFVVKEPLNDIL